jgi:hypothetical protein
MQAVTPSKRVDSNSEDDVSHTICMKTKINKKKRERKARIFENTRNKRSKSFSKSKFLPWLNWN